MTGRTLPEWIGKTLDDPVPPRVRARVFEARGGRCAECERRIPAGERWVCDHKLALVNGGENRERNLRPICAWCDRNVKTPADVAEKARVRRKQAAHLGLVRPKTPILSAGFAPTARTLAHAQRRRDREELERLAAAARGERS